LLFGIADTTKTAAVSLGRNLKGHTVSIRTAIAGSAENIFAAIKTADREE
jgi:hypothetical protein